MTAIPTSRVLPARQVRWTRLGAGMGYTNTEPKREQIRAAVAAMDWVDTEQQGDMLDTPIIRFYVTGLFSGRAWALTAAAMTRVPAEIAMDPFRDRSPWRLIGLRAVTENGTCCSTSATKPSTSTTTGPPASR